MTTKVLNDSEVIDYADHHSGTVYMGKGQVNPYKIGIELFRDIEDRWNKGKFGKEYDECDNYAEKRNWDKVLKLKGENKTFSESTEEDNVDIWTENYKKLAKKFLEICDFVEE